MTTRFDLFTTIHKALRAALFDALQRVARCDPASADDAADVAATVRRLAGFLGEHADHEDREVLPELAQVSGELAADLQGGHARVRGLEHESARLAERLADAPPAERGSLLRRLHEALGSLVAEQLLHMKREENEVNRMLWAHRTDEQLLALHGRILSAIPPVRVGEWLEIMLPAVNAPERAALEKLAASHVP